MSFRNPFKQHGPKKSAISRTAEREFERELKKLEQLDKNVQTIYKDMKKCIDSNIVQSRQECKIVQELGNSALCKEDNQLHETVDKWNQATQKLAGATQELNITSHKAVMEPMKKFSTVFPNVQYSAKKREQCLQEYNKCQAKVDKYQDRERTGPNIVKLDSSRKALNAARDDYDNLNSTLMDDMPRLYEGRLDYVEPSFKALIQAQVKYFTEAHIIYTELSAHLSSMNKDSISEMSDDEFDKRIQQKLNDIKALAITVDD